MSREKATRAPVSAWQAELLRFTLFPVRGAVVNADGLWERLTGQSPDHTTKKPKSGELIDIGSWGDFQLIVHSQTQAGRMDLTLSADNPEKDSPSLPDGVATFSQLVHKWVAESGLPNAARLAVGMNATLGVQDHFEGYRTVSNYLPFDVDRTVSRDFLYQINRVRRSTALADEKGEINRLMKWSASITRRVRFAVGGDGLQAFTDPETLKSACLAELDINTAPSESLTILPGKFSAVFDELVSFAIEIVQEGDIP